MYIISYVIVLLFNVLYRIEPFVGNDRRQRVLRQQSARKNRCTVGNGVFYGGPCRRVIRRTTGARKASLKGAAVQRGLEHGSRGIAIVRSRCTQLLMNILRAVKDLTCDLYSVEFSGGVVIKCNYGLCIKVVNKSSIQSNTPSRVTHLHDSILCNSLHVWIRLSTPGRVESLSHSLKKLRTRTKSS
jgi:hypothetical protein